ncbi:MAG: hypothetical protein ACJ0HK_01130 [Akkermansiaceae bacterium]
MKFSYPRRDLYAFVWAIFVFFATYLMRAANGLELFLISDIFNCGEDTILKFSIRWALWLSVPIVLFQSIRSRVGVGCATFSLIAWWITVTSGIQPMSSKYRSTKYCETALNIYITEHQEWLWRQLLF